MDEKTVHDLAVAYAHAKLLQEQQAHPENSGYSSEIRNFLKGYCFAKIHIPEELKEIDMSELL